MYKIILIFIFAHQVAGQNNSIDEILNIFSSNSVLEFGRLLAGSDDIGPIDQEVKFFCNNGKGNEYVQTYVNDSDLSSKLDASKPLHIATHGWIASTKQEWAQILKQNMAKFLDVNVCLVDWERMANFRYDIAATKHAPTVGDYIAEFVVQAKNFGISLDDVTLIGHSLGGQVMGRAGLKVSQLLGDLVGRIFGLDPAGPLFCFPTDVGANGRLDPTDAKFVQAIHTTSSALGCALNLGHQDFKPDGGIAPQTGCILAPLGQTISREPVSCSHSIATYYYVNSVDPANVYTGRRCQSFANFFINQCDAVTDVIGPYTKQIPGEFYMRTSAVSPYTPLPQTGNPIVDALSPIQSVLNSLLSTLQGLLQGVLKNVTGLVQRVLG